MRGSGGYRIDDLAKTAMAWQQTAILAYPSTSRPSRLAEGGEDGEMRRRGEEIRDETMTLVEWPGAASGDRSATGKRRLGYSIGLMSSTLRRPRHIIQWTSEYTRQLVKSSLGGEV